MCHKCGIRLRWFLMIPCGGFPVIYEMMLQRYMLDNPWMLGGAILVYLGILMAIIVMWRKMCNSSSTDDYDSEVKETGEQVVPSAVSEKILEKTEDDPSTSKSTVCLVLCDRSRFLVCPPLDMCVTVHPSTPQFDVFLEIPHLFSGSPCPCQESGKGQ